MRITFDHKKLYVVLFFFAGIFFSEKCIGQQKDSTKKKAGYSLYLYAGGGVSQYVSSLEPQAQGVTNKQLVKPIGTFRVMWQTDHRLGLGIESGIMTWYSYEAKHDSVTAKVKLTSIPILVTWSMQIAKNIKVFGGFGSYLMTSQLDVKSSVKSKTMSLGWALAGSYLQPLKDDLSLAYELKWCKAHETSDDILSLQLQLVWKFLQW
jgi:hypothetical protein